MPTIAILPGDGIGPEIMHEGVKVLQAAAKKHDLSLDLHEALVGGAAYDATGHPLPPETLALAQQSDAIYLGAVGGPKYDAIPDPNLRPERGALLPLRQKLGLYANLRPCVLYPSLAAACPLRPDLVEGGFDILVVRELTGGLYFGQPKGWEGDRALDTCVYTRAEITRIAHVGVSGRRKASESARPQRGQGQRPGNLPPLARDRHPGSERVPARHPLASVGGRDRDGPGPPPQSFDVIVTENLFGDILSDEAAQLTGSLGMLPSASLGERQTEGGTFGLYEPSHGSAPDIAGTGQANPLATILSGALLLRYSLGAEAAARDIEHAVAHVLQGGYRTRDIMEGDHMNHVTCRQMGDLVAGVVMRS